jgi:hypothetical protein
VLGITFEGVPGIWLETAGVVFAGAFWYCAVGTVLVGAAGAV